MPKSGYKLITNRHREQFEIPESWNYLRIRDLVIEHKILEIQDGNHGELHPKSIDFVEHGIPFITADCLTNNKIDYNKCHLLPEKFLKILRVGFAKKNDVLLSHKGNIGNTAIVDNKFETVILSPQTTYYRLSDDIMPYFLYYVFQSKDFQKQLKSLAKQSTRDYVGITNQQQLLIPYVSSKSEQQKIALVLSNVDELISSYNNIIETTKKLKTGLMQTLLTKGIGHKKFKKVEWFYGKEIEIPEEWHYQNLRLTTKLVGGFAFKSEDYVRIGISLLKIANISHGNLVWNEESFLPDDYWNTYQDYQIKKGDLVMAMTRPIISTGIKIAQIVENKKILLNQRVGKFLTTLNIDFLNYVINSKYFIAQIKRGLLESNQPNISASEVEAAKIWYPENIQEQQKIASILSSVDTKISELESKKSHLETIKKGLMQKLLTGQIRVKV